MKAYFRAYCECRYDAVLEIPDELTTPEEQREYIKDHLHEFPVGVLEYIPGTDELDDEEEITIV